MQNIPCHRTPSAIDPFFDFDGHFDQTITFRCLKTHQKYLEIFFATYQCTFNMFDGVKVAIYSLFSEKKKLKGLIQLLSNPEHEEVSPKRVERVTQVQVNFKINL